MKKKNELPAKQREELLSALKTRFEKNMNRHKGLDWSKVQAKLAANPQKLWSLNEMELPQSSLTPRMKQRCAKQSTQNPRGLCLLKHPPIQL